MGNTINSIKSKSGVVYDLTATRLKRNASTHDKLVSRMVTDESTGGLEFIPQDIENGIYLNDYQFYIQSKEGIKLTGITSANWDRGGLDASDPLHIGSDNYQSVTIEDLCTMANGTDKSNWKNCPDWTGEGYLCVLDQCAGAKRIKLSIPTTLEFDYFIVTGCGHNNGATALTPCNPTVLVCEDDEDGKFPANAKKDGIGYVSHKYSIVGNQRKEYFLYCSTAKKIWAQIEFYKYADDVNPFIDEAVYLRTDEGYPVTTEIEEYAALTEKGIPDFSALTLFNGKLIAASDNQGVGEAEMAHNSGIYEIGFNGKGNLKKVTNYDIEGLTASPTAIYACVEYDTNKPSADGAGAYDADFSPKSQNDILVMNINNEGINYDSIIPVATKLTTICGENVKANQGFEGITYYKTTDEFGDMLFVGNQNPMNVVLYSVKKNQVICEQTIDFSSEIAGMSYGLGYLWVIDSLTGNFYAASVNDANNYKITKVKNFSMIFTSGANENCESIVIDEENGCAWIGTEVGQRLYKITLPTKTVDGKKVLNLD